MHAKIINFLPASLTRKKLLIASFKTLTNSKDYFESYIKLLFRLFLLSLVDVLQSTFMAVLLKNFQDLTWLPEQL